MMRVGSIRYKKRKDRFNMTPILEEGMGQPASLYSYNTRVNALQEELCSTADAKGMAWHLRKTSCNPYHIITVHKPGLGHGSPTSICSFEGKERCGEGETCVSKKVVSESCKRTCGVIMSSDGNVGTQFSGGFCPWNVKGGMFCAIGKA